jgi:NAD(P)-dependent dehydrogenase (short-subunit alcohol dehydrogenase family)
LNPLTGKTALITGAGRGIGKRLAIGFASAGVRVGLLSRSQAELDLARLEIEHGGGIAIQLRADVRHFDQVATAVDCMRRTFGGVDILIAAAGVQGPIGPLWESSPELWSDTVAVNLIGAMHACRACLPHMIERRSGKLLILGGGGSASPRPGFSAYAASKAAVVRFVETVAEEVRGHNIQANCLAPGGAYTHMTDEIIAAGDRAGAKEVAQAEQIRMTGGVKADKQIQLALFLASERSNHVSGKLIHVNDDWKRLENTSLKPEAYTLRRVMKI